MRLATALATVLALTPAAHANYKEDIKDPCTKGISDADSELISATQKRTIRRASGRSPLHLFTRATPSGCARIRFLIDEKGVVHAPVIESFYPDPRFGREIVKLVRSMGFTPAQMPDGRDAAMVVIGISGAALFNEDEK